MLYRHLLLSAFIVLVFTASCNKKTDESKAHFLKGNEAIFNGDFTTATKEFDLALKIDDKNWQAAFSLASVYELQGDFQNAEHYFTQAVTINPNFAMGYFQRSMLWDLLGNQDAAAADLGKALSLKKDLFMAQLAKGQKLYAAARYKEALAALDAAIATRSDYFMAFSMRGSSRLQTGDIDGAIEDFKTELALNPNNQNAHANIAVALAQKKDYRAAITEITKVLTADPTWSQGYLTRGMYYYNLNIRDTACTDFRLAANLRNPEAGAYISKYCK